ncbi:hypothetical protein ACQ4PT_068985 [Festuca glaucescens]
MGLNGCRTPKDLCQLEISTRKKVPTKQSSSSPFHPRAGAGPHSSPSPLPQQLCFRFLPQTKLLPRRITATAVRVPCPTLIPVGLWTLRIQIYKLPLLLIQLHIPTPTVPTRTCRSCADDHRAGLKIRRPSMAEVVRADGESTLEQGLLASPEESNQLTYTGDGSVDFSGNRVVKEKTGRWRACPFILGNECCERLAYYGISTNLVTYLTKKLHDGNASAARNVTTWQGTCYLTPLIGAILADAYWGRYWTIATFSTIYFVGMSVLTLSATMPALIPPSCEGSFCPPADPYQYTVFFLGLYLIALGTGGIKPCVSSFGADQFDDTDPAE